MVLFYKTLNQAEYSASNTLSLPEIGQTYFAFISVIRELGLRQKN